MIDVLRRKGLLAAIGLAVLTATALACSSATEPAAMNNDTNPVPATSAGQSTNVQPGVSNAAAASPLEPEPPVFFIRQEAGITERAETDSMLNGELVIKNGCIRVNSSESDTSYLPIWPYQSKFEMSGDENHVRYWSDELIASVGEEVSIGGGKITSVEQLSQNIGNKMDGSCVGPYWIVASDDNYTQVDISPPPGTLMGMPIMPTPSNGNTPPIAPGIVVIEPDQQEAISEQDFMSLLTSADIESVTTTDAQWNSELLNYKAMADPVAVENIRSWYGVTFDTKDRTNGLTFTMMEFDSPGHARTHFELMLSEAPPGFDPTIDDTSIRVEVNDQGIGSMLFLLEGDRLFSLHSTFSDGDTAIVDLEGLEKLAEVASKRL